MGGTATDRSSRVPRQKAKLVRVGICESNSAGQAVMPPYNVDVIFLPAYVALPGLASCPDVHRCIGHTLYDACAPIGFTPMTH